MQDGEKYYALLSDENGNLSTAEVQVRDGMVVGPVTDYYLWDFRNPEQGSVRNMGSDYYLIRTSGGGSKLSATKDSGNKYVNWNYDAALHILYNPASGGSTRYFYPSAVSGELALRDMTALAEAGIYLMKVTGGDTPAPNTSTKIPNTADGSQVGLWAAMALAASAALTGAALRKKKAGA